MKNTKVRMPMELFAFFCSMVVIIVSAANLEGQIGMASLIGLIAGSFGAGAALTATINTRRELRRRQKDEGTV